MIAPDTLRLLSLGRWFVPVLATMSREGGARYAALVGQLGISRSALSNTLAALQQNGWLARNAGHGHPLRSEYVLTQDGRLIAAWCARVMEQRRKLGLEPSEFPRWSLPLVAEMDADWTRFSALRAGLKPITPRALSLTLKQMLSVDLVRRRLEDGFPPQPLYGLTPRGLDLASAMSIKPQRGEPARAS